MNNFVREINGSYNKSKHYTDTDSLYLKKKCWDMFDKACLVREKICKVKNDYEIGGVFYGIFLSSEIKILLTIDGYAIIQQQMTFKGFIDSKRLLDRS